MNNITAAFNNIYLPEKALIVYQSRAEENDVYIEAYDMDENGKPINAHPLSVNEISTMAECLSSCSHVSNDFLISKGLLPENVLYTNTQRGFALWYTPPQQVNLLFKDELSIPCGTAYVPSLVWKATKNSLWIYALKGNAKPKEATALYYAPFFNIHGNGNVCMGNVDIDISRKSSLEDFMTAWEAYFWNSYFSHLIGDVSPVQGNIIQLWQQQVNTNKKFPVEVLKKNRKTLKDLIL